MFTCCSSKNKHALLAGKQFTRTFATRTTGAKRKKAAKKEAEASPKTKLDEQAGSLRSVYPFCLHKKHTILPTHPITIPHHRMDDVNARYYRIQDGTETCTFPGVTHVLSATRPPSFAFALKNWQKNMTKKHGEEGFQKIRQLIRTQGHDFHKVSINIYIYS